MSPLTMSSSQTSDQRTRGSISGSPKFGNSIGKAMSHIFSSFWHAAPNPTLSSSSSPVTLSGSAMEREFAAAALRRRGRGRGGGDPCTALRSSQRRRLKNRSNKCRAKEDENAEIGRSPSTIVTSGAAVLPGRGRPDVGALHLARGWGRQTDNLQPLI